MNRGGGTLAPPGPPSGPGSACAGAPGETGCGPLPAREGVRGDGLNPSAAQAEVIVDELIRNEVRHVVLSPGSRNAPLSFALHAADAAGQGLIAQFSKLYTAETSGVYFAVIGIAVVLLGIGLWFYAPVVHRRMIGEQ